MADVTISPEDVERFKRIAASLSPADRAAIMGSSPTAARVPSHKMTPVLDALSDADVPKVVHACRAGLKHALTAATPEADFEALQQVGQAFPAVAAVARANSEYRRKPYAHSLNVICDYLQSETSHGKREAKRREVPPAAAAEPAPKSK